jgi:hypothetical protein
MVEQTGPQGIARKPVDLRRQCAYHRLCASVAYEGDEREESEGREEDQGHKIV